MKRKKKKKKNTEPLADQLVEPQFVSKRGKDGSIYVDRQDGEHIIRIRATGFRVLLISEATDQGILFDKVPFIIPFGQLKKLSSPTTNALDSALAKSVQAIESKDEESSKDWLALLRSYICIQFIFRDLVSVRPILLLVGPPGQGKSSIARSIGQLLFGERYRVTGFTSQQRDFDTAIGKTPYLALDNIEEAPRWICDRLSSIATKGDTAKRALYKDNTQILLRPDIFISISAVAPDWVRGDVLDRSLVLKCALPDEGRRLLDGECLDSILQKRDVAIMELINLGKKTMKLRQKARPLESRDRLIEFQTIGRQIAEAAGGAVEVARFDRGFRQARLQRHTLIRELDLDIDALFLVLEENDGVLSRTATGWMNEIAAVSEKTGTPDRHRDPLKAGPWLKGIKRKTSSLVKWTSEPRLRGQPRLTRAEFVESLEAADNTPINTRDHE